mgnify:CR=1 FL=1
MKALDDKTLEVKLTSPQPWFIQQSAHTFVPRRFQQETVEKFGDKWTEPANIVTERARSSSTSWEHSASIDLAEVGRVA